MIDPGIVLAVILIGLVTAFWVNLVTRSGAAPGWMVQLRHRGKPWSCPVCMSFWVAMIVTVLLSLMLYYGDPTPVPPMTATLFFQGLLALLFLTSASAMISIVIVAMMDRLETMFITTRKPDKGD